MCAETPTKLDVALQAAEAYMFRASQEEKARKFDALLAAAVATLFRASAQRGRLDVEQVLDLVTVVTLCDHTITDLILEALKEKAQPSSEWIDQSAMVN